MWQNKAAGINEQTHLITNKELPTLLKVSQALSSTLDLPDVLQIAITSVTDLLEIETGAIYTLQGEMLFLGATTPPLPPEFPDELRLANLNEHPHLKAAITKQAPVYLQDARAAQLTPAEQLVVDARHLISILYFPLMRKEQAIGAFIIGTTEAVRQFSESEIDICNILSSQSSLAITNAQMFAEKQAAVVSMTRAYNATLEGWSRLLDMRDHITDEHTRRVVKLTVALARWMGLPEDKLEHIRRGALLHDIGKIGIPDEILQKPGLLTNVERTIMQAHPQLAYMILRDIDYLVPALDIPYCHHEKWDGSGYPRQLQGEEIPLAARIFAVVDVFDALTSDRPYRRAWEKEQALAYIQEQSGRHFAPVVVDEFFEMLDQTAFDCV